MNTLDEHLRSINTEHRTVLITSVNYETRSLRGIFKFAEWCKSKTLLVNIELIALQARGRRVEPLEQLKSDNIASAETAVRVNCKTEPHRNEFSYPDGFTRHEFLFRMQQRSTTWTDVNNVIIDISALPTRVLIAVIDFASLLRTLSPPLRIHYCYTWPERYPSATNITQVGELRLLRYEMSLHAIPTDRIKCLVVLGSQGFDAGELLEVLPANASRELLLFMNREDIEHSMQVLVANATALSDTTATLHYFSTIERGAELMHQIANDAIAGRFEVLLVANFSAKPLTLGAYRAVAHFSANSPRQFGTFGDFIMLNTHHYGSVYSIGFGETCIYSHDIINGNPHLEALPNY